MCGIAGVLLRGHGHRPSGELLRRVAALLPAVAHRGPDDEGVWLDEAAGIGLGHRRLAIVDLTPTGAQPMVSADGRWVLSFNGEVYGFRRLRRDLIAQGARFRGTSDTEVLVEAISRRGVERALAGIDAMYALALWDTERRELWLARDPVGEKPLYIWDSPRGVVFASELGAMRAADGFDATIEHGALAAYLQLGYIPAPLAIYEGVRKLEAGEWLRFGVDGSRASGVIVPEVGDIEDALGSPQGLLELLADAVTIRTVADVPVGVFLSGGIDSTIVTALAARAGTTHTFTATFTESSHDESRHAAAVALALGTEHTELHVSAHDGLALARSLPSIYGEPFGDPSAIPTHLIAQQARQSVTVALTGDGGDELFGGYNRLTSGVRVEAWRRRLPPTSRRVFARALRAAKPTAFDRVGNLADRALHREEVPNLGEKLHKVAGVLGAASMEDAIRDLVTIWPRPADLLAGAVPYDLELDDGSFASEMLDLDRRITLPEQMLTKVDRATMAVALEARPPLLDPRVVAVARATPVSRHVRDGRGKQLLRGVLPELIAGHLVDRPKMGFDPPIGAWLRGPLRSFAAELLAPSALRASGITGARAVRESFDRHQAGAAGEDYRLWTVLQYQLWFAAVHERGRLPAPPVRPSAGSVSSAPRRSTPVSSSLVVRPFEEGDRDAVDALLAAAMRREAEDDRFRQLLRWKHEDNPFGRSPAWVAVDRGAVVGYRAFLRWRFEGQGRTWNAVRAVDTATDPRHQGRGIFRLLTLRGLEELTAAGVDFVFNTPNDQSRPGYLAMGWRLVGRLMPWVRPARLASLPALARSREPAAHWGEPCHAGVSAAEAFSDDAATAALLESCRRDDTRLRTERTAAYLRWRYDHELLGYRVLTLGADLAQGACCLRVRRRGSTLEATACDLLVPGNDHRARRALLAEAVRQTGADYALVLGAGAADGAVPIPNAGPTLVWRDVCSPDFPPLDRWDLTMGDIELF